MNSTTKKEYDEEAAWKQAQRLHREYALYQMKKDKPSVTEEQLKIFREQQKTKRETKQP